MLTLGEYQYGNVINDKYDAIINSQCAIYHNGEMICSFPTEQGKEIARLMMSWHGLNARSELTDRELMEELKERGYTGKLTLKREFEL